MLASAITMHVPINSKETKPPRIEAKNPVDLHNSTRNKIPNINPNGIILKINFVSLKHSHNWNHITNMKGII